MSAKPAVLPDRKITRDDIEAKLQELRGEVDQRTEAAKVPAIAIAVGVVVADDRRRVRVRPAPGEEAPDRARDPADLMLESLLRRLTTTGWRRGQSGSRTWLVVAAVAGGLRLLRYVTRDREEILYRTRVVRRRSVRDRHQKPPVSVNRPARRRYA